MLLLAVVLDEVTILLVIVPLLVPIAQGLNIDLIHFGIVVVLNMMVGLTLPPHGLLLFVMSGLTRTPLAEIFREMPPFIVAMLAIVIAVTLVPEIALWLPRDGRAAQLACPLFLALLPHSTVHPFPRALPRAASCPGRPARARWPRSGARTSGWSAAIPLPDRPADAAPD